MSFRLIDLVLDVPAVPIVGTESGLVGGLLLALAVGVIGFIVIRRRRKSSRP